MAEQGREYKQDLVLAPDEYAFLQDTGKGSLRVYKGPTVTTPSASDVPIIYDAKRGFVRCNSLLEAIRKSPTAPEGHYIVLKNPSSGAEHPDENTHSSPNLLVGRRINIPGPVMFALWPGQMAEVIQGHHLRSNEYLLIKVYNEEEARKNWANAIQKTVDGRDIPASKVPDDIANGKLYVVKGTDVAFYMPPTGISVVPEGRPDNGKKRYTRDALTLERLEYCILVDEDGNKRYERGPAVVFPHPTERFIEKHDKDGAHRKFRAIELNEIQGLHLKCIADFTDERGGMHKAGEEMFITGKDTQIYFPREEIAEVRYDGKSKHFASAVPKGEGRYILKRKTGEIKMERGPAMSLPNPIDEVFVRRVLSVRECELMYPGNNEVLAYNMALQELANKAPTTRAGAISEGDVERGSRKLRADLSKSALRGAELAGVNYLANAAPAAVAAAAYVADASEVSKDVNLMSGDEFSRASTYTDPRTVTLSTKYQGAPLINVFPGYAVQVVSKNGDRRVEVGPKAILLEYDETLEALSLSTKKPKTTDVLLNTAYLKVENNGVSDIIGAETSDHVQVSMKLSYRVNFEGDPSKWFVVENYVKFLCDHCRSVLKNAIRQLNIVTFHGSAEQIVRDTILGKHTDGKRAGMLFAENGMHVTDVEVLEVVIGNQKIRELLDGYQHGVVSSSIQLQQAQRDQEVHKQLEEIKAAKMKVEVANKLQADELNQQIIESEIQVTKKEAEAERVKQEEKSALQEMEEVAKDFLQKSEDDRTKLHAAIMFDVGKQQNALRIELAEAEADSFVKRISAAQPFGEAVKALGDEMVAVKVAEAMSVQNLLGGKSAVEVIANIFDGTPLKEWMAKKFEHVTIPSNGGDKPVVRR